MFYLSIDKYDNLEHKNLHKYRRQHIEISFEKLVLKQTLLIYSKDYLQK